MTHFHLSLPDTLIIVVVTLIIVFIGLFVGKKVRKTPKGYFLAAGKMPWYLVGAAFVSTNIGSEALVGTIGATYKNGMGIVNWEWWALPTYALTMVFFIPMYLRNQIGTVPELLNRRFGPVCSNIYSVIILIGYIFIFLPPVIYGGSITFSDLTGWNMYYVMGIIILLTASYTIMGGLTSVMLTDAIQGIFLIGGGIIFYFVALHHIPGGWSAMVKAAPERFHLYHPASDPISPFWGLIVGTFGVFLFFQSSNQVMIQRIMSAKSTWDGMMGIVFAGFINLFRPMVTCLVGLIIFQWLNVMHMGPSLLPNKQDNAFSIALEAFAPVGLKGVLLAGFFAAIMAAISALANSISTIFTLDIYHKFVRPEASDRKLVSIGRIASGVALLVACLLSPLVGKVGLFQYAQIGVTYLATPFISVIILGILWKRTNYKGAIYGLIGGTIIQILLVLVFYLAGIHMNWLYIGGIAEVLTIILIIIVSLNSPPPPDEKVKPFIWRYSWLQVLDDGVKRPWWQNVKLWFGLYALGFIYIYWRFW